MRHLESQEQQALFEWATLNTGKHPELESMYHIPNGGKRNKFEAARLKREGVKAGVPDICLPVARGIYHGLYIELKSENGKATENQKHWIKMLKEQGYRVELCNGWIEASKRILRYLEDDHHGTVADR